ncbi:MAG: glucose-1-phosphate adenylyltransferase family protein [Pyrinomonadaceae bacterium]
MRAGKVLALILAGGAGGRLDVLTEERAKPATPFAGTYRLIDFSLSNCMHSRIADVWVVEQYQPHSLNDHLANGRPWDLDRTYGGLQVLPPFVTKDGADEEKGGGFAQGNADALYRNRKFIREFAPDVLLVMSADHVYKLDYRQVLAAHAERGADVTMVTTRVPLAEANRFGAVKVDAEGRVTDFAYKPEKPESDIVTAEVFAYDARKLLATLDRLVAEKRERAHAGDEKEVMLKDYGHELLPQLVAEGRAYEYRLEGYWRDLGTVESYWQGHMDLLVNRPDLDLDDPEWPILTYGSQRMPARIEDSASISQSLLSPGCHIRGTVIRSVLSPGVNVEEGATVRDSVCCTTWW